MSLDLEGTIDATSVPHLIYTACSTRETGILRLRRDEVEKNVYIKDGRLVFATSTDRDDRLGHVLLRNGKIGIERLTEATERSLREGKRLGGVLVESGYLKPADLVQGVVDQVREILLSVFDWTSGSYQVEFGDLPTKEVITLNVNTADLLREGIRRIRSWYRIQEALGGLDAAFRQPEGVERTAARMKLSEDELSLLTSLERPATLRELCRWSPLGDFETGRILWVFLATGLVVRAAGARTQGIG
jgi:hypothetical protein